MIGIIDYLGKQSKTRVEVIMVSGLLALGGLDYITGPEIAFSLFYLAPVFGVTWFIDRRRGILISLVSTFICLVADLKTSDFSHHPAIPYWNPMVRLELPNGGQAAGKEAL